MTAKANPRRLAVFALPAFWLGLFVLAPFLIVLGIWRLQRKPVDPTDALLK